MSAIPAGEPIAEQFTLRHPDTGELTNADSAPAATLTRNGADTGEEVTVSNLGTGIYMWSVTIPSTWDQYDLISIRIGVSVSGIDDGYHVWRGVVAPATGNTNVSAEVSNLRAILNSGQSSYSIEGQSVSYDLSAIRRRLAELTGTRKRASRIDLSGF